MIKKNILILCSAYFESTSANGVCAKNMAEEFVSNGHNVWVIATSQKSITKAVNGVMVFGIPSGLHARSISKYQQKSGFCGRILYTAVRGFWGFLSVFSYPKNIDKSRIKKVKSLANQIIKDNDITHILATSFPYDSIEVGLQFKKIYKEKIRLVTYHFDLMFYPDNSNKLVYSFKRWRFINSFNEEIRIADRILLPESCTDEFESNKVIKTGLPIYLTDKEIISSDVVFSDKYINICYIGSLVSPNRDPKPVVEVLEKVSVRLPKPIMLHIWGKVVGNSLLSEIKRSPIVKYHGSIDNCYVQDIYMKSDFLLNIGNKIVYSLLPSKIFQYFASQKPIINFVQHPMDFSKKYFMDYGNTVFIWSYENNIDINNIVKDIQERIDTCSNNKTETFLRFTPKFLCGLVTSL